MSDSNLFFLILYILTLQFLSEMSKLFAHNQTSGGSIYITMKRVDNSEKKPTPRPISKIRAPKSKNKKAAATALAAAIAAREKADAEAANKPAEHMCLIRVQNNKRKISTVVAAKDVNKFQQVTFFILIFRIFFLIIIFSLGLL